MQEGMNLNLVLNGATLLSVLGLGVKVYLAGRAQRIEQPLEIKAAESHTSRELCEERHAEIKRQMSNLFAHRDAKAEELAALSAKVDQQGDQLKSMDGKLDTLLKRLK